MLDEPRPGASAREQKERLARRRRRRDPTSEASKAELAWEKGADGELRLGRRLEDGARILGGIGLLHDLVVPGRRANLDHVVVGPAGVTVIDAKAWSGDLWLGTKVVGRGTKADRAPVEGMLRQVAELRGALAAAGRSDVPVAGLVCFVNDNKGVPEHHLTEVDGVPMGRPAPVIRHAMRGGPLDEVDAAAVQILLRGAFDVRGGEHPVGPRLVVDREGEVVPVHAATPPVRLAPVGEDPRPLPRRPRRPAPRPRGRRASRRRRLQRRGLGFDLFKLCVLLVLLASVGKAADNSSDTSPAPLPAPTVAPGGELTRGQLIELTSSFRSIAADLAGGRVRGPRVVSRPRSFVLSYRRGASCRVWLSVRRDVPPDAVIVPTARTRDC